MTEKTEGKNAMNTFEKQFVYIMSNDKYQGIVKVGKGPKNHPEVRANYLSRQTGARGKFKVEWIREVPDATVAENILHFKLKEFWDEKEFFKVSIAKAIEICEKTIQEFFKDELLEIEARELEEQLNLLDISDWDRIII